MLRVAGGKLAEVLRIVATRAVPGTSALELDQLAEREIRARGALPLFLQYDPGDAPYPYPATLCVSVNDEVVHGIPTAERVLRDGDIVSLDIGLLYEGYSADMATTIIVGEGDADAWRLVKGTKEALDAAIGAAKAGGHIGDIGAAVAEVAKKYDLTVVRDLGGHGTGKKEFHEEPYIANFGSRGQGEKIVAGHVLALEPIFALGSGAIKLAQDGWTYRTRDHSRAAHFEHTIIVGESGAEVVTV